MHVVKKYPDGVFSWVDLTTSDTAGAKAFYAGLFGWEFLDLPTDMGTIYSMAQIEGHNVAGLGPAMDPNMPTFWASYVNHSDVDAVVERAAKAGGTVMMPPMDVMDSGRMTMIQDPSGAVFGVWQPNNHMGAQLVNMPNTLVWNELQTRDPEAAKAFYAATFGWTDSSDPNGYVMYSVDERVQAGMITMDETWGPVPPNWSVYFMVDDVDAAAEKVKELGGNIMVPPVAAGEMGRFAVVQDPQGGVFTVMTFNGPVDTPPG
jgi:predicted enzyme related to lactoylglutathione lyase